MRMLRAYLVLGLSTEPSRLQALDVQSLPLRRRSLAESTQAASPLATWRTDPFLAGLRQYLHAHACSVATHTDLLAALSNATGKCTGVCSPLIPVQSIVRHVAACAGQPVGEWMNAWVQRSGFPVVHVGLVVDAQGNSALHLRQHPIEPGGNCSPSSQWSPWWIPVAYSMPLVSATQAVLCTRGGSYKAPSLWLPACPLAMASQGAAGNGTMPLSQLNWLTFDQCEARLRLPAGSRSPAYVLLNAGRFG